MASTWHVYALECADGSIYTGITTDPHRRLYEHNETPKGARYTRSRRPVKMLVCNPCADRGDALRRERRFRKLSAAEKRKRLKDL